MRFFISALLVTATLSLPLVSFAQDTLGGGQGPRTLAVQNRQHSMMHEFGAWVGMLPLDAFEKGLTFTGAYTLHFNDLIAWEVAQFTYSYGIDSKLKDDLNSLLVKPTEFETVRFYGTSNVIVKPLYGKLALLNRTLIFGEIFFMAGGGYGALTVTNRPVIDVGGGMRLYVGDHLSVRIDARDYMFVNTDDLHNELWIALGICLSFD